MKLLTRAVLIVALISFAGLASANQITLTFDTGAFDETILPENSGGLHGPYAWLENGARIEGFWAEDVGTPGGFYQQGHLHPVDGRPGRDTGVKESTHAWTNGLQGLEITLDNGATFDLISIDFRVNELERAGDPLLQRLPWSYAVGDPHLLAAASFDPTVADFESQWTGYAVTQTVAWQTLTFSGFENLTSVLISQSAHNVWLDNIVIEVHPMLPIPEPSMALLMGLGLVALARRRSTLNN